MTSTFTKKHFIREYTFTNSIPFSFSVLTYNNVNFTGEYFIINYENQ